MDAHQPPTVEQLTIGEYANLLAEANNATAEARALLRKTHGDLEEANATIAELEAKLADHAEEDGPAIGEYPPGVIPVGRDGEGVVTAGGANV